MPSIAQFERNRPGIPPLTCARSPPCEQLSAAAFATLADDLEALWAAPTTDARLKKRIVRTVIREVLADIDQDASEIVLTVHWAGGVHTERRLPKRRRGQRNSTAPDIIDAVRLLVRIASDDLIAGLLNRNGLVTGNGNRWTRERVTSLRSHHRIPVHRPAADGVEPWLNLTKAASFFTSRRRRSDGQPRTARSRPSTPSPTVPGSSAARFSKTTREKPSPSGPNHSPNTPRDRIPINKTSSLQLNRQMGVVMPDCSDAARIR